MGTDVRRGPEDPEPSAFPNWLLRLGQRHRLRSRFSFPRVSLSRSIPLSLSLSFLSTGPRVRSLLRRVGRAAAVGCCCCSRGVALRLWYVRIRPLRGSPPLPLRSFLLCFLPPPRFFQFPLGRAFCASRIWFPALLGVEPLRARPVSLWQGWCKLGRAGRRAGRQVP